MQAPAGTALRRHWRRTRLLTLALLLCWAGVSFLLPWYSRELGFTFLGVPFSYYFASQGAPLTFLLIVWLYARGQDGNDREAREALRGTAKTAPGGPAGHGA
jgi:putative solute:sodium symporter small subunit